LVFSFRFQKQAYEPRSHIVGIQSTSLTTKLHNIQSETCQDYLVGLGAEDKDVK